MKQLDRDLYIKNLQDAIEKSPSYTKGMQVLDTGNGVVIVINGKEIDINEQCIVLADGDNYIRYSNK